MASTGSHHHDSQHIINMVSGGGGAGSSAPDAAAAGASRQAGSPSYHAASYHHRQQLRSPLAPGPSSTNAGVGSLGFDHLSATPNASSFGYDHNLSAGSGAAGPSKDSLARSLSLAYGSSDTMPHSTGYQQHQTLSPGAAPSPSSHTSPYSPMHPNHFMPSNTPMASSSYMAQDAPSSSSRNAVQRDSLLPTVNTHTGGYQSYASGPRSPMNPHTGASASRSPRTSMALGAPPYLSYENKDHGMGYAAGSGQQQGSGRVRDLSVEIGDLGAGRLSGDYGGQMSAGTRDSLPYSYSSQPPRARTTSTTGPAFGGSTAGPPPMRRQVLDGQQQQQQQVSSELSRRASTSRAVPPAPPVIKEQGLRRVRDVSDLRPKLDPAQAALSRRADPSGGFVSPLKAMTSYLHHTYHLVNPSFIYELSFNPRRVLTKPSKPMHNHGHDNEDSDYILYVNDWLGSEEGNRYLILDILGQGTFGQVVKCQNMRTHEIVAVKVIKNKPAYYKQSIMEVTILENLNANWDPEDKHHILRLRDTFIHAEHLCLVFELLSSNLYELIKQNSFKGLSTSLVRVFTTQLLDSLTVLNEARLIHCDLKPENILLRTLQEPSIKLVDFGSACHEKQTVYTYIQSRFYRSPEVLLGLPYNSAIDMWSLGCIAVELFLGLPLFPGTSEYNQVCRIVEMLGLPPAFMLEQGKQTTDFFNVFTDEYGRKTYRLKSREQYMKEHNPNEVPSKKYFVATTLPEIVKTYPLSRKSGKPADAQKEMANRASFVDFVSGLLNMDPHERWTPQQAKLHPFITGEKFVKPFKPPRLSPQVGVSRSKSDAGNANKHQFGGLQTTASSSRQSGPRAYHDAAAYNQHLAQQQAYNSAAARQGQAALAVSHNPYAAPGTTVQDQAKAAHAAAAANAAAQAQAQAQAQHAQAHAAAQAQIQAQLQAQQAAQAHAAMSGYGGPLPGLTGSAGAAAGARGGRPRSNTQSISGATAAAAMAQAQAAANKANLGIGSPPGPGGLMTASAMSMSPSGREEWERRQASSSSQQFDLLEAGGGGAGGQWGQGGGNRWMSPPQQQGSRSPYASPRQTSSTPARQYHSPSGQPSSSSSGGGAGSGFSVVVEPHHHQQQGSGGSTGHGASSQLPNPHDAPRAPSSSLAPQQQQQQQQQQRYMSTSPSGGSGGLPPFDAFADSLTLGIGQPSIAQLMPALKPQQYHAQQSHHFGGQGQGSGLLPSHQGGGGGGGQRHSMILPTTSQGSARMSPYLQQQQQHGQQQQQSPLIPGGFPSSSGAGGRGTTSPYPEGQSRRYSHQQGFQ